MAISLTSVEKAIGYDIDLICHGAGNYEATCNWEYGTATVYGKTRKGVLKDLLEHVYKLRRAWVYKNAKGLCGNCGGFYTDGDVHHREFRSHGRCDLIENLVYLCRKCHKMYHLRKSGAYGKTASSL